MSQATISDILGHLMFIKKIRTAALARELNIPQPTVHRIVTGTSPNPHISSLIPLAKYFNITVEQLRGLESIPALRDSGIGSLFQGPRSNIPLLQPEQAAWWMQHNPMERNSIDVTTLHKTSIPLEASKAAFAISSPDSSLMPIFLKGSILSFDPNIVPTDGSYVLVQLGDQSLPIMRKLILDGSRLIIKSLNPELANYPMIELGDRDEILAVLIYSSTSYRNK